MGFLIFLIVVGALVGAYVFRVQLLSKVLGQDEARIRRQIERKSSPWNAHLVEVRGKKR